MTIFIYIYIYMYIYIYIYNIQTYMRIVIYSLIAFLLKLPFRGPFRENPLLLLGSFWDWTFLLFGMFWWHFPGTIDEENDQESEGKRLENSRNGKNLPGTLPGKPTSPSGKLPGLRDFAMSENCEETPRQIIKATPFKLSGAFFWKCSYIIYTNVYVFVQLFLEP